MPGLAAEPIIDVMVGVRSLDAARQFFDVLDPSGYRYRPHRVWMHWFCKPSPARRTHHSISSSRTTRSSLPGSPSATTYGRIQTRRTPLWRPENRACQAVSG
jgi:GrpB-like predicted nucleotidyltransferase (UPF0157 family)